MEEPSTEEKLAIQQFLFRATLPVLYDWGDKGLDQIGTGTLFAVSDRHFFITARHLFKDSKLHEYDPTKIAFPETPLGTTPYTFGEFDLCLPDLESLDVAVIELRQADAIERLKSGWRFLSPANVTIPPGGGWFILCGYPSGLLIRRGGTLGGSLVAAYTSRIPDFPSDANPPPDSRVDMFFDYDKEATAIDGRIIQTPSLPGMSGASIWHLSEPKHSPVWTAESCLRIVGVQSAWDKHERSYFRAINWLGVIEVFRRLDGRLASDIEDGMTR